MLRIMCQTVISLGERQRRALRDQSDQSLVILAFAFLGLIAMLGLALDLGLVYIERVRIKRAVDATTLAGVVELPFEEDSLDGIFASFILELFDTPEIPRVLDESRRVLRFGGRICIVSLSKAGGRRWLRELYECGHRAFPGLVDCRPIFVQRSMQDAGFRIVDGTRTSVWGLPIDIVLAGWP